MAWANHGPIGPDDAKGSTDDQRHIQYEPFSRLQWRETAGRRGRAKSTGAVLPGSDLGYTAEFETANEFDKALIRQAAFLVIFCRGPPGQATAGEYVNSAATR